ncbi:MAG: metallophosphoesterase [Planctomycetia bacterium]|nr:metallophosphoesterase [Planctomycetia bacterium]
MSTQPFRFIHAADLHLEMPVNGLVECPEHLEDQILNAPQRAVERLFNYAIEEKVDFIVLSGDVIASQITGPWGLLFLIDQFQKLQDEKIEVYWAGGSVDSPEDLPSAFQFPLNVHLFPVGQIQEFIYKRGEVPIARIIGTSRGKQQINFRPGDIPPDPDGLYSVGVHYGRILPESIKGDSVQYWALGGNHHREFLSKNPVFIHYPGPTLARNPNDSGDFGASLVEVNEYGRTKVDLIKTSPIQWITERILIQNEMTEEEILAELRQRIKKLRNVQNDILFLISLRLDVDGDMIQELRYGNLTQSLLRDLRTDFGKEKPIAYCIDLKPILPDKFPLDLYDQQTILGDYLRMVHFYQENHENKIDLNLYYSEELQSFLEIKQKLKQQNERLQQTQNNEHSDHLPTDSEETISFRPQVQTLINLLCMNSSDEISDVSNDQSDSLQAKLRERFDLMRSEVLREASMIGLELLSAKENETSRKTNQPRRNPNLAWERKNQIKNEGKEGF